MTTTLYGDANADTNAQRIVTTASATRPDERSGRAPATSTSAASAGSKFGRSTAHGRRPRPAARPPVALLEGGQRYPRRPGTALRRPGGRRRRGTVLRVQPHRGSHLPEASEHDTGSVSALALARGTATPAACGAPHLRRLRRDWVSYLPPARPGARRRPGLRPPRDPRRRAGAPVSISSPAQNSATTTSTSASTRLRKHISGKIAGIGCGYSDSAVARLRSAPVGTPLQRRAASTSPSTPATHRPEPARRPLLLVDLDQDGISDAPLYEDPTIATASRPNPERGGDGEGQRQPRRRRAAPTPASRGLRPARRL